MLSTSTSIVSEVIIHFDLIYSYDKQQSRVNFVGVGYVLSMSVHSVTLDEMLRLQLPSAALLSSTHRSGSTAVVWSRKLAIASLFKYRRDNVFQ